MDWIHSLLTFLAAILLIAVSISSISAKWDYRVKLAFLYLWIVISSVLIIPITLIIRDPYKAADIWAKILFPVSYLVKLNYKVIGNERIDWSKPYVILCNHQTSLDVFSTIKVRKTSIIL